MMPSATLPIVFISYHSDEIAYAEFIAQLLDVRCRGHIKVFVAKRDIPSGADPSKTMLIENLLKADVVIPICSRRSVASGWVWWESASTWARGRYVHPLFLDISPKDFGDPMKLLCQGRSYFDIGELEDTVSQVAKNVGIASKPTPLNENEKRELKALQNKLVPALCKVSIAYTPVEEASHRHVYSLSFEVENVSLKKFDSLHVRLLFPYEAIERKDVHYDHLRLTKCKRPDDLFGEFIFDFDALPEGGKKQFSVNLLPGSALRIFGHPDGIYHFRYIVDTLGYQDMDVRWEIFVDGHLANKGSKPFAELNRF